MNSGGSISCAASLRALHDRAVDYRHSCLPMLKWKNVGHNSETSS